MTLRLISAGAVAALSLSSVACERDTTNDAPVTTTSPAGQTAAPAASAAERRNNALVRVVHAVPAGSTVDIYADDERVFNGLAYKAVTSYREVPGERLSFEVRPAGMSKAEPIASNSEGLDDGDHYTVFAVPGDQTAAMLRVVKDDHSKPATGKARLRVVHASSDAGEIDIHAAGRRDPLIDGVDFQNVSTYTDIDPVAGTVTVRPEGESTAMLTLRDVRFDAGKTYTLVVVGRVATGPRIDAFVIEDVTADTLP